VCYLDRAYGSGYSWYELKFDVLAVVGIAVLAMLDNGIFGVIFAVGVGSTSTS
jgi:hypothetical protein